MFDIHKRPVVSLDRKFVVVCKTKQEISFAP